MCVYWEWGCCEVWLVSHSHGGLPVGLRGRCQAIGAAAVGEWVV